VLREFAARERGEARPAAVLGQEGGQAVLLALGIELEEEQVGELFQIIAIANAVIAQSVAEVPDFLDEGAVVHFFDSA